MMLLRSHGNVKESTLLWTLAGSMELQTCISNSSTWVVATGLPQKCLTYESSAVDCKAPTSCFAENWHCCVTTIHQPFSDSDCPAAVVNDFGHVSCCWSYFGYTTVTAVFAPHLNHGAVVPK